MRNSARVKALDSQIRDHIMKAKAFTEAASAHGKALTSSEDVQVKSHLAAIETLKAEREGLLASEAKADRLRVGVRDLGEWRIAAKALTEGRQSVTLNGLALFGKSGVSDSDLATDEQTGRAVIERPGITALPLDDRYVYSLFPREDPAGALAVSEFKQSARAIGSGEVLRSGVLDTSDKAELDVTIQHVSENMLQVAVLIKDVPNGLFEAEGALAGFLAAEMNKQLAEAIDGHVLSEIAATTPASAGGGDSLAASIRYGIAAARDNGIHPDALIVTGAQATELDTMKAIDMPKATPTGWARFVSPSPRRAPCSWTPRSRACCTSAPSASTATRTPGSTTTRPRCVRRPTCCSSCGTRTPSWALTSPPAERSCTREGSAHRRALPHLHPHPPDPSETSSMKLFDGLRRKSVTIVDPFARFTTVGPFDFARDHAPVETLTLGQLYEQSAPARAGVRTLASGVGQVHFAVGIDASPTARPVGDGRLEKALNDPRLIVACTTDLSVWGNAVAVMIGEQFIHVPWPAVMVTGSGLLPTGYTVNSQTYRPEDVLHFRHPRATFGDLLTGAAPLEACRVVLEEDLAAFRAAAADARGANRFIKRPIDAPKWGDTARMRFEQRIKGLLKAQASPPVLEEGMDIEAVPQTVDASWTPARRLAYDAVCSVLGVPPAMVAAADSDRNQDASQRSFMVDGVMPVAAIIAQEATLKAVPHFYGDNPLVGRIVIKAEAADYGRDRFAERARAYALAIGTAEAPGWLSPDEVRLIEGMEPR